MPGRIGGLLSFDGENASELNLLQGRTWSYASKSTGKHNVRLSIFLGSNEYFHMSYSGSSASAPSFLNPARLNKLMLHVLSGLIIRRIREYRICLPHIKQCGIFPKKQMIVNHELLDCEYTAAYHHIFRST